MSTGPSTSTSPYLIESEPNVRFVSIATAGNTLAGGGVFGGLPDGLGAFDNGDGTITVLVNHELANTSGLLRDHGATGAYIDRLVIDKATLAVTASDDLIKTVYGWNDATDQWVAGPVAFNRFCSADLADSGAFLNQASGLGSTSRIYLTGEEGSVEGRATATIVTGDNAGTLYELPSLGNLAFENIVANSYQQDKTVLALTDDGQNGQVYIYIGQKQATGNEIEKAGLFGGDLYGIKVTGVIDESNDAPANGTFSLQEMGAGGDVSNMTGAQLDAESEGEQVTSFLRPEDFAWDPDNANVGYFVTTNSFSGNSRLYKMVFTDITQPELGGTITAVVDGTEGLGAHMFDNITVADGKVIIQEDPGNQNYLARIWEYDIAADSLTELAEFDPAQFTPGAAGFITSDEESSGVIDVTAMLGDADTRAYLLDAQVHFRTGDPATFEMGQLLAMYVDDPFLEGGKGSDNLFGSAAVETLRGYNGDDTARAGSGNDTLLGGNGNDTLSGDRGNDDISGENGDDRLIGGAGDDDLTGGRGSDSFIIDNSRDSGFDRIRDFTQADRLLTTVKLPDGNADGIVTFGDDDELDLFGASEVAITSKGMAVNKLGFDGIVELDGQTYYSYGLLDGGLSVAAINQAAVSYALIHDFKI